MEWKEVYRIIKEHPERYFEKTKYGYICPVCGNGSGKSKTGITKYHEGYKCFKCGTCGDVLDFMEKAENINKVEAMKKACELNNIEYKSFEFKKDTHNTEHTHNTQDTEPTPNKEPLKEDVELSERIKADILEAQKHLEETTYITKERGISIETAKRFKLGFLENWTHPKARNNSRAYQLPCLIIPTSETSYTARNIAGNVDKKQRYQHAGEVCIFNEPALYDTSKPCFICEGEIDALSILDLGFNAVALGSASNINLLVKAITKAPKMTSFIIYFDNDDTGKRDSETAIKALRELGVSVVNITGKEENYHDVNDYFRAFKESLATFLYDAVEQLDEEKERVRQDYINTNNALSYLGDFLNGIKNSVNTPYTATGFKELDNILDGGLYEGLYIIGAISSLGKTTFILQVADQIAKSGKDVLFFSLEQARAELMAKSISRETALYCKENNIDTSNAKTVRGITVASRYNTYNDTEKQVISNAIQKYKTTAKNLFIYEGLADIGVKKIKETVEKHIEATGNKPIVFVDYLQILAPYDDKNRTDKQVIDLNITALKRLSRSLKLSIIGISSFNRDNYNTSVNMSSFKESGAIEYSSDVLIGLQFKGIDDIKQSDSNKKEANEFVDNAKAKNPREVELKLLKNRNGATSSIAYFKYYPMFNLYEEVTEEEQIIDEAYKDYRTAKGRY